MKVRVLTYSCSQKYKGEKEWLNTSKTCSNATPNSRNVSSSCGAFFDADSARKQLAALEEKVSDPDFWQNQEKAQGLLQQRKQVEDRVNAEKFLETKSSDIETYFNLAREEADDAQRDSLLEDVSKELVSEIGRAHV